MDMVGKEALETMLKNFEGTVLFLSHDRYFIKQIATEILEFSKDEVKQFHCGYEDYLIEKNKKITVSKDHEQKKANSSNPTIEDVFDKKTYYNPGKVKTRLTRQLEKYGAMLTESEERAENLKMQMLDPELAADYQKLMELQNLLEEEEHQQESLLERMLETETELAELEI